MLRQNLSKFYRINSSQLKPGLYYLRVNSKKGVIVKKVIVFIEHRINGTHKGRIVHLKKEPILFI